MNTPRRIARLPRTMWLLGMIEDPSDKRAAKRKAATFYRRYRHNRNFPEPLDLPDGQLAYWEHEVLAYLESRPRGGDPRDHVEPLPAHWCRSNRRGNAISNDTQTPPEAA